MSDPVRIIARRLGRCCAPLAIATLDDRRSEPWQSLLFDGGRHSFALRLDGAGLDDAVAAIRDEIAADFAVPGHVVADIRVVGVDRDDRQTVVSFEALTIEDRPGNWPA